MCGKIFWKGIIVFSLTFGFGVFVSGDFVSNKIRQNVVQPNFIKQEFTQPKTLFDPKELNKNSTPKPLCRRYGKNEISELRKEHEKLTKSLKVNKDVSPEEKEKILKRIAGIEESVLAILKKPLKKQNTPPSESKPAHNLLFVPNCEEY